MVRVHLEGDRGELYQLKSSRKRCFSIGKKKEEEGGGERKRKKGPVPRLCRVVAVVVKRKMGYRIL
jgi:hypothetical protein